MPPSSDLVITSVRLPASIIAALSSLPRSERSEFIRTALAAALDGTYLLPPAAVDEVRQLREELRRVGVNLNQLVQLLHLARTGGTAPTAAEVSAVVTRIGECAQECGSLLRRWRGRS